MKYRTAIYIDGFNLYHSLRPDQRWLDLRRMVNAFCTRSDLVVKIKYFTAYCSWDANKATRHRILTGIYQDMGIEIVLGKFKKITRHCRMPVLGCSGAYQTHEEKQTDVNVAMHLLNDAWLNLYDRAYIISGDTDLLPPIRMIKKQFPEKLLSVVFPPNKKADEVKAVCNTIKMKSRQIYESLLPDPYTASDGAVFYAPKGWI